MRTALRYIGMGLTSAAIASAVVSLGAWLQCSMVGGLEVSYKPEMKTLALPWYLLGDTQIIRQVETLRSIPERVIERINDSSDLKTQERGLELWNSASRLMFWQGMLSGLNFIVAFSIFSMLLVSMSDHLSKPKASPSRKHPSKNAHP